jgi:hypothetical protein
MEPLPFLIFTLSALIWLPGGVYLIMNRVLHRKRR